MRVEPGTKCFVDSNVWLYLLLKEQSPREFTATKELLDNVVPVLSTQVINEVCVNLLRHPLFDESRIQRLIHSFYSRYEVHELDSRTLLMASDLRRRYSISFWDGLIVASALETGSIVLLTEDMQDQLVVEKHLRIVNPYIAQA